MAGVGPRRPGSPTRVVTRGSAARGPGARLGHHLRGLAGGLRRCPACRRAPAAANGACSGCEQRLREAVATLPPPGGPRFWLGPYAGPWLRLVHALKYERDERVAGLLGALLAARLLAGAFRPTVVTYAPASAERRRERGFDQAELLARAVANELSTTNAPARPPSAVTLLHRSAASPSQGRLSRSARVLNAGASFNADSCRGERVLLVDDVLTTGATTGACVAALVASGAAEVWIAVVARTARARGS